MMTWAPVAIMALIQFAPRWLGQPGQQRPQTPPLQRIAGVEPNLDEASYQGLLVALRTGTIEQLREAEVQLLRAGFMGSATLCRNRVQELSAQTAQSSQMASAVDAAVKAKLDALGLTPEVLAAIKANQAKPAAPAAKAPVTNGTASQMPDEAAALLAASAKVPQGAVVGPTKVG